MELKTQFLKNKNSIPMVQKIGLAFANPKWYAFFVKFALTFDILCYV